VHELSLFHIDTDMTGPVPGLEKDQISCTEFIDVDTFSYLHLLFCRAGKIDVEDGLVAFIDKTGAVYALKGKSAVLIRRSSPGVILGIEFFHGRCVF
jgi:hypothetical protein